MQMLLRLFVNALAIMITAYVLRGGVTIENFWTAIIVAILLIIVNIFIKPLLMILTLPFNIITLGLFTFVINALMILLVDYLVPGFQVNGFWWALGFAVILSLVNAVLNRLTK